MSTIHTGEKNFEEVAGFFQNWPFQGQTPFPRVIRKQDVYFRAWGPSEDGLHRSPCHYYVSTKAMTFGVFTLAPGDWFEPGNHPDGEPYYMLEGSIHVGNADTGQLVPVYPGEAVLIPGNMFHFGYNFGSEMMKLLFMIPRDVMTAEFREHPVYDDHYKNFREPILLHREPRHESYEHETWAQPGLLPDDPPRSRHADLLRWPAPHGVSTTYNPDVDYHHFQHKSDWLHFATGSGADYAHHVLTSFVWSTREYQFGTITIPPGRTSSPVEVNGDRVYYPLGDDAELIVNIMETAESLFAASGEAIYVPPNVPHQFQNPGRAAVETLFAAASYPGSLLY